MGREASGRLVHRLLASRDFGLFFFGIAAEGSARLRTSRGQRWEVPRSLSSEQYLAQLAVRWRVALRIEGGPLRVAGFAFTRRSRRDSPLDRVASLIQRETAA